MPVLPDVLRPGLRVVFCGTAAGDRSAAVRAYYAGKGNQFWSILWCTGLTPRLLTPGEYTVLPDYGIGLTDLAKTVSGNDADTGRRFFDAAGVARKLERFAPRVIAFNGKTSGRIFLGRATEYGLQPERVGSTAVWVLPSTSGAARRYWDPQHWHALAACLRRQPHHLN